MITKKDESLYKRYINGTVGYIKSFVQDNNEAIKEIIIETKNRTIHLPRSVWHKMKLNSLGQQVEDERQFFAQFSLQLAWATTIHKEQDMTFDSTYVDFGNKGAFSVGQAYVG